jgi:hypothetical protein
MPRIVSYSSIHTSWIRLFLFLVSTIRIAIHGRLVAGAHLLLGAERLTFAGRKAYHESRKRAADTSKIHFCFSAIQMTYLLQT